MKKIGIIDIGSNSVRLSVAEIGENFNIVLENNIHCRLAEGLDIREPELKAVPVMRTVLAISKLLYEAMGIGCNEVYAVATEAVRCADNAQWFIDTVKDSTGLDVRVLEYEDEAGFDCIAALYETGLRDFVLIDTGGGSTEIAICKGGEVFKSASFSWGAVTMTERFSESGVISDDNFRRFIEYVSEGLSSADWLWEGYGLPLVMTGGSLKCYSEFSDRYSLSDFAVEMQKRTPEERQKFGIQERRADTIAAGVIPAMILSAAISPTEYRVCRGGLCQGFLIEKGEKYNEEIC